MGGWFWRGAGFGRGGRGCRAGFGRRCRRCRGWCGRGRVGGLIGCCAGRFRTRRAVALILGCGRVFRSRHLGELERPTRRHLPAQHTTPQHRVPVAQVQHVTDQPGRCRDRDRFDGCHFERQELPHQSSNRQPRFALLVDRLRRVRRCWSSHAHRPDRPGLASRSRRLEGGAVGRGVAGRPRTAAPG